MEQGIQSGKDMMSGNELSEPQKEIEGGKTNFLLLEEEMMSTIASE
jgi:hypothetical protein